MIIQPATILDMREQLTTIPKMFEFRTIHAMSFRPSSLYTGRNQNKGLDA